MKEKFYRFMQGRYGSDQLNRFLMFLVLLLFVVSLFGLRFAYLLGIIVLVYAYFRMFSKNIYKRRMENAAYMKYEYRVKQFFATWKRDMIQRKTHHIYRCPSCRQKIRIPRGKGKIEIRCPKCGQTFIKKS
ncbi:MAG: zinc-ribbon domain-containing protein [Clostridium sp.]|nr:zinc-ribbon domain-containing protein [Clostridium sp.]